jgi:hypothetical protein
MILADILWTYRYGRDLEEITRRTKTIKTAMDII